MNQTNILLVSECSERTTELSDMIDEANRFLLSQRWCEQVHETFLYRFWPGILAIFLIELQPVNDSNADKTVWVVVGDVPPAYLDTENCKNGKEALKGYINEMEYWIHQVESGLSVSDAIPVLRRGSLVPIEVTNDYCKMLKSRIEYINDSLLIEL